MPFLNRQPGSLDKELNLLIKQLIHKDTTKREQAKQTIMTAIVEDPQRLSALLFRVERELHNVRLLVRWIKFGAACFVLFFIWDLIEQRWFRAFELLIKNCGSFVLLTMPLNSQPRLKALLNIISELQDKRFVGPLVEAYRYQEVRSVVAKSLSGLLPQLQYSDAGLLNEQQRTILCQSLNSKEANWTLTVLKALEQIGDSKAVPYVEKLANAPTTAPEVRIAAQECLTVLQIRLEQQQVSQTLLRASSVSAPPEALLRAASAANNSEPDQLLRAGNMSAAGDSR